MSDIYIILTGRRGHGKDSVANIAIDKFDCTGKVALADWFKEELSKVLNIPICYFYDIDKKDTPLPKSIIITESNLIRLRNILGEYGFRGYLTMPISQWVGREFNSIRDLLIWFGADVVRKYCSPTFHCEVTLRKLEKMPRSQKHTHSVFFVTDARYHDQSKFFIDYLSNVYTVLVVRPGGSQDDNPTESCVDAFPEGYFFRKIIANNLEELEQRVKLVLEDIREDMKKKLEKERKGNIIK